MDAVRFISMLVLVAALAACPGLAYAQEGSGSSDPAVILPADSAPRDVVVSSDGQSAFASGSSFAVDGFTRLQAGSNRLVDDAYRGYIYSMGRSADSLALVATADDVVVYMPPTAASSLGIDMNDEQAIADLQACLLRLDGEQASGGDEIAPQAQWHFTQSQEYVLDGVLYRFGQQLKPGRYYACIIGEDGSDVTQPDNPRSIALSHACYASLTPSDALAVTASPSWTEGAAAFLARLDLSPLWVTLKTTGTAIAIVFILGLLAAYWSLSMSPRMQNVIDSIFTVPMVLPPTVCGFLLLLALGNNTAVGRWFGDVGFPLVFSWPATVIAAVVVAFPLMYRSARGAFEALDPNMLDAARTLGWGEWRIFFRLMLPLAWSSIAAGTVLAFARALGEFGATLFLAGNYLGVTRTIPIAIYFEWMNGNTDIALFWTAVILIFSFVVILLINLWGRRATRYRLKAVE